MYLSVESLQALSQLIVNLALYCLLNMHQSKNEFME